MKFKSWYIVLLGIILQVGFGFLIVAAGDDSDTWGGVVALTLGIVVIILSIILALFLGVLPMMLLMFEKTRKAGAIISIVFGIIGIITQWGILIGVPLVVAGIIALWRKI